MKLFQDLLSTDYGLMSASVIAITIGMAVWYGTYFVRKVREDAARAQR